MFHTASTQPMAATMHSFGTLCRLGHFDPAPALELIEAGLAVRISACEPP
jgi:hypothetical protein